MLTRKQHELLVYIDSHLKSTGFSPSFEEMKEALQLRSKSGIHRLISALEERGFLQRRHHRARALEVVKLPNEGFERPLASAEPREAAQDAVIPGVVAPDFIAPDFVAPDFVAPVFTPTVIQGSFKKTIAGVRAANDASAVQLPLYGRIAAGLPLTAEADESRFIDVPASLLGNGEHYALEVDGLSMRDAGILDGDTVIIKRGDHFETGEIIVALVDGYEVTLKRLRRHGRTIALEPANPDFKPQILPADKVQIQGKLVALFRHY